MVVGVVVVAVVVVLLVVVGVVIVVVVVAVVCASLHAKAPVLVSTWIVLGSTRESFTAPSAAPGQTWDSAV